MPDLYSNGSGTPPSYRYYLVNNKNQCATPLTLPSNCAVTKIKVYAAGYYANVSTRLAIWSPGGSLKVQSSTFTMGSGSASVGGQSWNSRDVTPTYLSSGTYWVGLYRNPGTGHIMGTTSTGTTGYTKTNTASFPNISSMSGYASDDKRMYVGVFYILPPNAPSSLSVSRNSDTSQTISWTRNATTDRPYTSQILYKYNIIHGTYSPLKTLSGSATSYTDTTTIANRYYKYKIVAVNAAGTSGYSNEDDINTTPAAPTDVVATRVGSTVEIDWVENATNETALTIERKTSSDNISWTSYSVLDSGLSPDENHYVDNSPANFNQYQIKATCTNPTLSSSYAESNIIQTLSEPDAPTGLSPNAIGINGSTDNIFSWNHNSNDSTAQSKYSLHYRIVGAGSWTDYADEVANTNEYVNITSGEFTNGNTYEWQVMTWGEYATGSDWSDIATFTAVSVPVGNITSPTDVTDYPQSTLVIQWDYTQAESQKQVQYIAILESRSADEPYTYTILETKTASTDLASGETGSVTMDTVLENEKVYRVRLTVQCEDQLWSEESSIVFTTGFLQPTKPLLTLDLNRVQGSMDIEITNPDVVTEYNNTSTQDSYVYNYTGYGDTNYDGEGELNMYYGGGSDAQSICLDFDLSFFVGKSIVNAQLLLYRKSAYSGDMESEVHYINDTWDETSVTYNNLSSKIDGSAYGSHAHVDGEAETWDVTSLLEDIADETITDFEGFYIVPNAGTGYPTDEFYDKSIVGSEPTIYIEISPENAETDYNILYRSINGGAWELVETNIPKNTTVTDHIPNVGGNNNYYVQAISATPSSNNSDETDLDVNLTGSYFLNGSEGLGTAIKFVGDVTCDENRSRDEVIRQFAGRTYPVKYQGNNKTQILSFSADCPFDTLYDDLVTIIEYIGHIFYRDWHGRYFYCQIDNPSYKEKTNTSYQFSCTINRIENPNL
jgi:hypothetical protein